MTLFLIVITLFFYFLKLVLKSLKQVTFKGWSAWDVCEGKIIMFSPNSYVCSIVFEVTWNLCSSKTNKCLLVREIPLVLTSWNKIIIFWKGNWASMFCLYNHTCIWFTKFIHSHHIASLTWRYKTLVQIFYFH